MDDILDQYYGYITDFLDATLEENKPQIEMENSGIGHYEFQGYKSFDHGHDYPVFVEDPVEVVYFDFPMVQHRTLAWVVKWMMTEPFSSYIDVELPYDEKYSDEQIVRCYYEIDNISKVGRQLNVHIIWKELEHL